MIQPGSQLAHYEVVSALGKGGMGEVWRAKDSKLGREVAIKTLPEEFAKDEQRLARFEREAKLLASLNHPNIATIHGLEEDNGTRFLVLELVEGETLADRLKRGAIPVEESLKLALQIAEALEAAHEKGVIHRDLKPANIKITPDGKVKVLDFGLAKALMGDASDVNLSHSPTLSMQATGQGVILGTAAYMSPEQARGEGTDRRADVWAFGVVLFEMLTGHGTFDGRTVSDVLAGVLAREPQWNTLPPNLHPRLRIVIERCLAKESKDRGHDIADVRVDIQKVLADPDGVMVQPVADVVQAPPRPILPWVAATAILSVVVAGVTAWYLRPAPEPGPVTRFHHVLPEGQTIFTPGRINVTVSPDGSRIVYVADGRLHMRTLDAFESSPISGTDENPGAPFFSPDGEWIGYWSANDGQLKKIAVSGGAPLQLAPVTPPFGKISWGIDDVIVWGQAEGIMSVSANGGTPELLIPSAQAGSLGSPEILPDGKSLLFHVADNSGIQIAVASLESGEPNVLLPGLHPRYVPTGHLVYGSPENVLLAIRFDVDTLEVVDGPVSMVEDAAFGQYALSDTGSLVYLSGGLGGQRELVWVDREGREEAINAPPRGYRYPRLSPDETRIAVDILEGATNEDIWIWDLALENFTKLTLDPSRDTHPAWTPDSERIIFASDREGVRNLYSKAANRPEEPQRLTEGPDQQAAMAISPDASRVVFREGSPQYDLMVLQLDEEGRTEPLAQTTYSEITADISPDGRWIAYDSDESGQREVYVRSFPNVSGARIPVSAGGGGTRPVWARNPQELELFYMRTDGPEAAIMSIRVRGGETWSAIDPRLCSKNHTFMTTRPE